MKKASLLLGILVFTTATLSLAQVNLSSDSRDYQDADQFMKMCTEFNAERADKEQICEQVWNTYKK